MLLIKDPAPSDTDQRYPHGHGSTTAGLFLAIHSAIINPGVDVVYEDSDLCSEDLAERVEAILNKLRGIRASLLVSFQEDTPKCIRLNYVRAGASIRRAPLG